MNILKINSFKLQKIIVICSGEMTPSPKCQKNAKAGIDNFSLENISVIILCDLEYDYNIVYVKLVQNAYYKLNSVV